MEKHSHAKVFERLYGVERVIRVILQISELDLDRVIRLMEIRATPCDAGAICLWNRFFFGRLVGGT